MNNHVFNAAVVVACIIAGVAIYTTAWLNSGEATLPNHNKVQLMGNITRDIEVRYTPGGMAVCQVGIAINRTWRDKQTNEQREETTFVDCDAFGRTAEVMSQYLGKGKPVFIEGRLKLDQWQDKDGNNRSKLKVIIEGFQFLDSKGDGGGQGGRSQSRGGNGQQQGGGYGGGYDAGGYGTDVDDDDIPY